MKKLFLLVFTLLLIPSLAACDNRPVLKILAPGEYMSTEIRKSFTKEHGIRVRIDEFESNEEALTFIKSNKNYDLILPSDYALEQLIVENQGYILPIDWSKITTFNKDTDLADGLDDILAKLSEENDLLKYGVPYFWGSVGILYDKDVVEEADLALGWDLLRQGDKYKVAFYDSSRDALMSGLVSLGYSINSNVASEINEAEEWLREGMNKANVGYVTDNIFDDIPSKRYNLAMAYTGDAAEIIEQMHEEEEDINLDFFIPEEGSNVWVDFLAIHSKGNEEYAYLFLNHIMSKQGATENSNEVYYISPREDVRLEQIERANTEEAKKLFTIVFSDKYDIFRYDPESKRLIDEAWNKLGVNR